MGVGGSGSVKKTAWKSGTGETQKRAKFGNTDKILHSYGFINFTMFSYFKETEMGHFNDI